MEANNAGSSRQARGAERVLTVLRELAGHPDGVSLDALARSLGAPKSTVHRALGVLARTGMAQQTARGQYVLGTEFVRLAFAHHEARSEVQLVTPCLEELAATLGEAAHYAELEDAEVIYRAQVRPPGDGMQMTWVVGGRKPALCTGVGKALLAASLGPQATAAQLVGRLGRLEAGTGQTPVDPEALLAELRATAQRGYAIDDEESEPGVNGVALAIYTGSPTAPSGAIGVSTLARRLPLSELEARVGEIREIVDRHLGPVRRSGPAWPS